MNNKIMVQAIFDGDTAAARAFIDDSDDGRNELADEMNRQGCFLISDEEDWLDLLSDYRSLVAAVNCYSGYGDRRYHGSHKTFDDTTSSDFAQFQRGSFWEFGISGLRKEAFHFDAWTREKFEDEVSYLEYIQAILDFDLDYSGAVITIAADEPLLCRVKKLLSESITDISVIFSKN